MDLLAGNVSLKLIVRRPRRFVDQKAPVTTDFFHKIVAQIDFNHQASSGCDSLAVLLFLGIGQLRVFLQRDIFNDADGLPGAAEFISQRDQR